MLPKDPFFDVRYPDLSYLRARAKKRMPSFAYDYLSGGSHENINLKKNTDDLRKIELEPVYLSNFEAPNLRTTLFGTTYDYPFGISPIGLQGLMWPRSSEILAKAAAQFNLPFILSTVSTASIEKIGEITNKKAWFQLYYPSSKTHRDSLIKRAARHASVLVLLADTPAFGYRPKEIRNGLSMPPRMTWNNVWQAITHPTWSLETFSAGLPQFATLQPYLPKKINLKQLGNFMSQTFSGRLNSERIKEIREKWPGKLVVKGIVNVRDLEQVLAIGCDGVIVSNHGGRQLDAGTSSIVAMEKLLKQYGTQTTIMLDSGIRSGGDVARALAAGAQFTFLGRSFMYSVAALGKTGGEHMISLLARQLTQVLAQLSCDSPVKLPKFRQK